VYPLPPRPGSIGRVLIEAAVLFPAPADVVFEMLSDSDYVSRKATAMGALEHDVTVADLGAGRTRIRLQRTLPSMVPDFVKPLVGPTIEVVQTEDWTAPDSDGARRADLRAQISAAPVSLSGEMTLQPTDDGTTIHRVQVTVRAKVPFVGGKIEQQVRGYLDHLITKAQAFLADWLSKR
jgi:uncharacterized protein YndB with AHSA1/START domain